MVKIYVGNLPHTTTDQELREAFEVFGEVRSAKIIKDKVSGQSRGFGFVDMPDRSEALAAINGLNGQTFGDRILTVNEARPREERREPQKEYALDFQDSNPDSDLDWDDSRRRRRNRRDRDRRDRNRYRRDRDYDDGPPPRERRGRRRRYEDDDDWESY